MNNNKQLTPAQSFKIRIDKMIDLPNDLKFQIMQDIDQLLIEEKKHIIEAHEDFINEYALDYYHNRYESNQ